MANRIQEVLDDANIELASVASEVLGVAGRAMIAALIGGESDPEKLAELARRRLRGKIPQPTQALRGRVSGHHRFMLRILMDRVRHLDQLIEQFSDRIDEVIRPFAQAVGRLVTIPGVNRRAAEVIVAEIGTDMARSPTAGHLASWAGMCSGSHQSAGERQSGRTTKGDRWLRQVLVQVAWAATRTKDTFLSRRPIIAGWSGWGRSGRWWPWVIRSLSSSTNR